MTDHSGEATYREFLELLPLTLELAGLSRSEGLRCFNTEQMEARAQIVEVAYRIARQTARTAIHSASPQTRA